MTPRRCLVAFFLLSAAAASVPAGDPVSPVPGKAALAWALPWDADWVTSVTFAGPTRRLAAGNKLGQILLYELPEKGGTPAPLPVRRLDGHTNAVTALASTPDGRWLISASYDHTVRVWDLEAPTTGSDAVVLVSKSKGKGKKEGAAPSVKVATQQAARVLDAHKEWVRSLSLSADGKRLLTGDDKGIAILWDLHSGKELKRLTVQGWLNAVALSPDAARAATCSYAPRYATFPNAVRLWDVAAGEVRHDLGKSLKPNSPVLRSASAAFSPDGKVLALGQGGEVEGGNGKVFLYDAATGKPLRELPGHLGGVTAVAFHPDGKHLASVGRDTVVRLWTVADGKPAGELGKGRGGQFKDWLHAVAFSADGRRLAAADMAGQMQVWQLAPE